MQNIRSVIRGTYDEKTKVSTDQGLWLSQTDRHADREASRQVGKYGPMRKYSRTNQEAIDMTLQQHDIELDK